MFNSRIQMDKKQQTHYTIRTTIFCTHIHPYMTSHEHQCSVQSNLVYLQSHESIHVYIDGMYYIEKRFVYFLFDFLSLSFFFLLFLWGVARGEMGCSLSSSMPHALIACQLRYIYNNRALKRISEYETCRFSFFFSIYPHSPSLFYLYILF